MDPETVLNLLDSYWYNLDLFKPNSNAGRFRCNSLTLESNPPQKNRTPEITVSIPTQTKLIPHPRSDSVSPNSVLFRPKSEFHRKKKGFTKSLSDLEYRELKGFMDLGFVFSEEDKDSNLASIIPGLQRLGQKSEGNINISEYLEGKNGIPRPYLSESWDKNRVYDNYLMNLKVPASISKSEIDMKHYLRFWAHSVASSCR